jgi:hypothetical protein
MGLACAKRSWVDVVWAGVCCRLSRGACCIRTKWYSRCAVSTCMCIYCWPMCIACMHVRACIGARCAYCCVWDGEEREKLQSACWSLRTSAGDLREALRVAGRLHQHVPLRVGRAQPAGGERAPADRGAVHRRPRHLRLRGRPPPLPALGCRV